MKTVQIGVDFKEVQRKNTEAEIKRMIDLGVEQISIEDMQNKLAAIGLTLDLNENSYLYLYYNTSSENSYLEASTSPIDNKKISAYNTNSEFYNKHLKGGLRFYTEIGRMLQEEIRNNYFCTYKKRGQTYILCF